MKYCLIHEMLGCIYALLVLEVGLRDLDKSFHISYLCIENFWLDVSEIICLSHAAQLPVLNGCKCSLTFHESSNISFNISYLGNY